MVSQSSGFGASRKSLTQCGYRAWSQRLCWTIEHLVKNIWKVYEARTMRQLDRDPEYISCKFTMEPLLCEAVATEMLAQIGRAWKWWLYQHQLIVLCQVFAKTSSRALIVSTLAEGGTWIFYISWPKQQETPAAPAVLFHLWDLAESTESDLSRGSESRIELESYFATGFRASYKGLGERRFTKHERDGNRTRTEIWPTLLGIFSDGREVYYLQRDNHSRTWEVQWKVLANK